MFDLSGKKGLKSYFINCIVTCVDKVMNGIGIHGLNRWFAQNGLESLPEMTSLSCWYITLSYNCACHTQVYGAF